MNKQIIKKIFKDIENLDTDFGKYNFMVIDLKHYKKIKKKVFKIIDKK